MTLQTLDDIRCANKTRGHYWFEPDAMRFFKSRVYDETVIPLKDGGALFVSSEKGPHQMARQFSIRRARPGGDVGTYGVFQAYSTKKAAMRHAQEAARKLDETESAQ
jgi:hypothetical protein